MTIPMPHDTADLMMAPVVLAVDQRLEQLGGLTPEELAMRVVLESNRSIHNAAEAAAAALDAIAYLVDLHSWTISWDPRGLRLTHAGHTLVLGVPDNIREYVRTGPTTA